MKSGSHRFSRDARQVDRTLVKVLNIHERAFPVPAEAVGALIDTLASRDDALWPDHSWPRMIFDRPLRVGATGGHGQIRYRVEEYAPGRFIKFRFTGPKGFDGFHAYEVAIGEGNTTLLRHTLDMTARGLAVLSWPLMFRPLHDALIEDSLAVAEASLGQPPRVRAWSLWVRFLRLLISAGKAESQSTPDVRKAVPASSRGGRVFGMEPTRK